MQSSLLLLTHLIGCGFTEKESNDIRERSSSNRNTATHDCSFSSFPNSQLSVYDCNPVFQITETEEDWTGRLDSIDIRTSPNGEYLLWYTSTPENGSYGLGLASSRNGSKWEIHPENPLLSSQNGAWDQDAMAGHIVMWDPILSEYLMLYQGFTLSTNGVDSGIWGLGAATSPDGISWTKSAANPVINFGDFDIVSGGDLISPCWPLTITINARGAFRGYIAATSPESAPFEPNNSACNIYTMTGSDSETWIIDQNQSVFEGATDYDQNGFAAVDIVQIDAIQYMFYVGFSEWIQQDGYRTAANMSLNIATSVDEGETWVRSESNPLPIADPRSVKAQRVNDDVYLWVSNENNEIDLYQFQIASTTSSAE